MGKYADITIFLPKDEDVGIITIYVFLSFPTSLQLFFVFPV